MDIIWQDIIKYFGGLAILSTCFTYLMKKIISHYFSIDIEKHKSELKSSTDKEIENLKSQLLITANEHQFRFSKLHEKRDAIIEELYVKLLKAQKELNVSLIEGKTKHGRSSFVFKFTTKLNDYFFEKKIYFSPNLCEVIEDYIKVIELLKEEEDLTLISNAIEILNNIKEIIETEFRSILGVEKIHRIIPLTTTAELSKKEL